MIIQTRSLHQNDSDIETDNIKIFTFLNQPSFSKSTKESYTRILRNFFSFFNNYGLKDITDVHVILYLKSLDKKPATKNLIVKFNSSLFSYLTKTGYIDRNPLTTIKSEKIEEICQTKMNINPRAGGIFILFNKKQDQLKLFFFDATGSQEFVKILYY